MKTYREPTLEKLKALRDTHDAIGMPLPETDEALALWQAAPSLLNYIIALAEAAEKYDHGHLDHNGQGCSTARGGCQCGLLQLRDARDAKIEGLV